MIRMQKIELEKNLDFCNKVANKSRDLMQKLKSTTSIREQKKILALIDENLYDIAVISNSHNVQKSLKTRKVAKRN